MTVADRIPPPPECAGAGFAESDLEELARRPDGMRDLVRGSTHVIHLAAKLPQHLLTEAAYRSMNVGVTEQLAVVAAGEGVSRFVFASTIEMYGPQAVPRPLEETAERLFTGIYSRTKWECEQILTGISAESGMEAVFLRMPLIMGPGFRNEGTVLRAFSFMRWGVPLPVPAPDALVAFVSARDVAQAFELAATVSGISGEAFNIAASDNPTMMEHMRQVVSGVGSRSRPYPVWRPLISAVVAASRWSAGRPGATLFGAPAELVPFISVGGAYSIGKARKVLGYAPQDSCADSWINTYNWWRGSRRETVRWAVERKRWRSPIARACVRCRSRGVRLLRAFLVDDANATKSGCPDS